MSAGEPPLNAPEIRRLTPVLEPGHTYASVTDKIASIVLTRPVSLGWLAGFGLAFSLMMVLMISLAWLIIKGVGVWGINIPIGWGFAIVNFVWWIGIGHAGTLISAILYLLNQQWRTSINRFAEAMTLFAVACAGIFPLIHTGRPWMAYYMFPYPSTMGLWPQFRSPLIWDVFAVSTYGTVSLLFWFVGLVPDLATLRDRATTKPKQIIYGMLALGWRGSAHHWQRYQSAYLLLAGLATPLVLSVHSVISFDFSVSIVPGWHTTIFPPYFVAGAIYSGFAMVLTIAIPLRKAYDLQDFITMRHLENMAKVMLATGLIVAYGYFFEFFLAFYSGNKFDVFLATQRLHGPYAPYYYALILCNILTPQLLWFQKMRTNVAVLFVMSLVINTGMWLERFVIVVISLTRDFMPSAWGRYQPTFWDWSTFIGTLGLFVSLLFLFVRGLPAIAISEMRELVAHTSEDDA
ncbi:MAG TPA: NrfD/PsrC family molybdoenzyme membrane anchor subunit [Candidatus Dormibacteraeota bacterium]|jgi:Ni/Fe-hydrogenase subunit HybB-like protein|nr:NrfD/PsrC family molybdoenzyme membrane anchor subunit [Candidatus Dormibacteraeota bacterium]